MISSILFIIGLASLLWSIILTLKELILLLNAIIIKKTYNFDFTYIWLFSLIGLSLMFYHLGIIFK